jgi:hypothetical protein
MHTIESKKILEWVDCGTYRATACGQYYAYKEGGLWQAGRVMFGRDIDFRISFPTIASARQYLQQYESEKVIYLAD